MAAPSYALGSAIALGLFVLIASTDESAAADGAPVDLAAACTTLQRPSVCYPSHADATTGGACLGKCLAAIHAHADELKAAALQACEAKVVEADGKARFTCGTTSTASKREDPVKLEALFSEAVRSRNLTELDAVVARIIAGDAIDREIACTTACNDRGRSRIRAPKEAPALVRAYKLCMVRTDSTPEARKFAAYDRDLYEDLIEKANDRCRTASKCDWLEEFSNLECTYGGRGM